MSEGAPEYSSKQIQPPVNERAEQTKPRNFPDFPSRLKELFQRKKSKPESKITGSSVAPDKATEVRQISPIVAESTISQIQSSEQSQQVDQAIEIEGATNSIHPDIEEGARYVLEKKLIDSVRIGSTIGIKVGIRELSDAWKRAQMAANARFEFTPEGKQEVPERIRRICSEHMQEGLAKIYDVAEFGIQKGWESSIRDEPNKVADFYKTADEFQIPLTYSPPQPEARVGGNSLATVITTREQAVDYMQQVIDRNLPQGIKGIIDSLGYQVGQGLLKDVPDYEERVERWIDIMQKRGWTVVDQPTAPVIGEDKPGLLERHINRVEIRQLIDQAIRDNLAQGARKISEMVGHQVKTGWYDPISTWGSPENIALYTEAGQRYGLTHRGGVTAENGDVNPNMYFDPTELPSHVQEAVRQNLPTGIEAISARHIYNIRSGDASQIEFTERTMEQYINLAGEYGVSVDPEQLRTSMTSHLTQENLQQGVSERINTVRTALRKAGYSELYSRDAEKFRKFVYDRGFGDKVDFTGLDKYLHETATEVPRLTEGTIKGKAHD